MTRGSKTVDNEELSILIQCVLKFMIKNNLTVEQFAEMASLSKVTVSNTIHRKRPPTIFTLMKLVNVLDKDEELHQTIKTLRLF